MKLMNHPNFAEGSAVVALGTMVINEIIKWDAVFHSLASILACTAAIVSIIITIRNRKK